MFDFDTVVLIIFAAVNILGGIWAAVNSILNRNAKLADEVFIREKQLNECKLEHERIKSEYSKLKIYTKKLYLKYKKLQARFERLKTMYISLKEQMNE